MADKSIIRKNLFNRHTLDLSQVFRKPVDVFGCPICFMGFQSSDLEGNLLTIGHVWPDGLIKYLSQKLNQARSIHANKKVLLCYDCNHGSGSENDGSLTEFSRFRDIRATGEYYRPQVSILFEPNRKAYNAGSIRVKQTGNNSGTIRFPRNPRNGMPLYPPDLRQRMEEKGECFTIILEEKFDIPGEWDRAKVSLLTSAYLMAFYAFGYRYILHSQLNEVRSIIKESFEGAGNTKISENSDDAISVYPCSVHSTINPELEFVMSTAKRPNILRVSFLDYHINLPFALSPTFTPFKNKIFGETEVEHIESVIGVSNHELHGGECIVDFLLDRPDYSIENKPK